MLLHRWLLSLLCALMSGGCTTPYSPPVVVKGSTDFPGLVDQLDPKEPLDVVLVHGMCTHDKTWAYGAMDEIVKAIDQNSSPSSSAPASLEMQEVEAPKIEVIHRENIVPGGKLHFTALVWSKLTEPLKQQLLFDKTGSRSDCATANECKPTRAKFNGEFKDGLLDDCLSDALIYEGVSRPIIRRAMVSVLSQVLADDTEVRRPLVLVTNSLGSKMVFDALSDMLDGAAPASTQRLGKRAAERIGLVFMNANQIPLLGLSDQSVSQPPLALTSIDEAPTQPVDSLKRYLVARRVHGLSALTVVALTDPNDLLSYRLMPSRYAGENVRMADVLVSNTKTYLGLFARPDTVHTGYSANPDVARVIACGLESSGKNPRCR